MYISGMLMYMGTLDFEVPGGVAIRRRPLLGSTFHSPQVFEKLWPFMEADGNISNVVLGNKYQSKLLEIIDAKWNVSAPAARPNPQGSYKYGQINVTASYMLKNKPPMIINGTLQTTLNGISYSAPTTPLRLADQYKVQGIYTLDFPTRPLVGPPRIGTSVINGTYKGFMEVIFQNNDTTVQSYHMDGYAFFVVGMDFGVWTENSRGTYNKWDAVARSTTQPRNQVHEDSSTRNQVMLAMICKFSMLRTYRTTVKSTTGR